MKMMMAAVVMMMMIGKMPLYKACTVSGVGMHFQLFLNLELRWGGQSASRPWPLPLGKELPYLFNSRLGGPLRLSGRFGEKKNLLTLPVFETRILVNVVTTISHQ
jgi:hypothetical protein